MSADADIIIKVNCSAPWRSRNSHPHLHSDLPVCMLIWVSPSNVYAEIQASLHFGIAAVRDFYNKKGALDLHFCKIQSAFALCHVVYSKKRTCQYIF